MSCVLSEEIVTQDGHKIISLTLNAERSLNALTFDMMEIIFPTLQTVQDDDSVVAVILDGAGEKAFCAGGDIINLYKSMTGEGESGFGERFFTLEYQLDYLIHTFRKPIICWGAGIVMGGGMGLMNGCSHRIVTETSHLAMPEVTIGLYPDVGGSWFLNRMPGRTGLFLGLTGNPMNAADALWLGLADRFLTKDMRERMVTNLQAADWGSEKGAHSVVNATLRALEHEAKAQHSLNSTVLAHFDTIQALTDHDSVVDIVAALAALETEDKWLNRAKKAITHGSPLAIHLIAEQLKRCKHMSLQEVFHAELILSVQCCNNDEFPEGIRALLVDKDGQPKWTFSHVAEVDQDVVDGFFAPPWETNPLLAAVGVI